MSESSTDSPKDSFNQLCKLPMVLITATYLTNGSRSMQYNFWTTMDTAVSTTTLTTSMFLNSTRPVYQPRHKHPRQWQFMRQWWWWARVLSVEQAYVVTSLTTANPCSNLLEIDLFIADLHAIIHINLITYSINIHLNYYSNNKTFVLCNSTR